MPAPKPAEVKLKPETEGDDSYEAAMRAADALFSVRADKPAPVEPLQASENSTQPDAPTTHDRGGRILRAIEEAPSPQYAALEAQFAPKRRGRKPGSKNKPKVGLTSVVDQAPVVEAESASLLAPSEPAPIAAISAAQRQVAAAPSSMPAARAGKRASWLRGKPKPGEDWKRRRLPRVCW